MAVTKTTSTPRTSSTRPRSQTSRPSSSSTAQKRATGTSSTQTSQSTRSAQQARSTSSVGSTQPTRPSEGTRQAPRDQFQASAELKESGGASQGEQASSPLLAGLRENYGAPASSGTKTSGEVAPVGATQPSGTGQQTARPEDATPGKPEGGQAPGTGKPEDARKSEQAPGTGKPEDVKAGEQAPGAGKPESGQHAEPAPGAGKTEPKNSSWIPDWVHTSLDVAGMVPGLGEIADGLNGLLYLSKGDLANASISAAALLPIGGQAATGSRLAYKAGKEVVEAASEAGAKKAVKALPSNDLKPFLKNDPVGQALEAGSTRTKKQNGGAQVYEVRDKLELPGGAQLKKGDQYHLDTLHRDHLEVYNKRNNFTQAVNLDGTVNPAKTQAGLREGRTLPD